MLKYLRIQNIILIEHEEISFEKGLNAITGETGAGKSALIEALGLIVGERADHTIIRKGCDKGVVEASFEIDNVKGIFTLLEQAGIEHPSDEMLIIRRELSTTGKSRCLINNQMAHLTLVREIGSLLIDRIGQHANQRLRTIESHRQILDLFADASDLLIEVKQEWQTCSALRKQLNELVEGEAQRLRDIEVCRMELEELLSSPFKEGEEEELFSEYSLLSNAEERGIKIDEVLSSLSGDKVSIITLLNRHKGTLDSLAKLDQTLVEPVNSYQSALIELQEISYTLRNYRERIEYNPERSTAVNQRLTQLNRLKRKYGATIQEIHEYQMRTEEKLKILENADVQIEELKSNLAASEQRCDKLCVMLTDKRKKNAQLFEEEVIKHLRSLNMPKVEFHIQIESKNRSEYGDDKIEFFLLPNVGEHPIPIKECASGGELSRLMLAIQTILAGKEQIPTLVFDEIDSNIGGHTAVVVGDKLCEMGKSHQVLCITHFQQVACRAAHHLQIAKSEEAGRTVARVASLDDASRERELSRMLGI